MKTYLHIGEQETTWGYKVCLDCLLQTAESNTTVSKPSDVGEKPEWICEVKSDIEGEEN